MKDNRELTSGLQVDKFGSFAAVSKTPMTLENCFNFLLERPHKAPLGALRDYLVRTLHCFWLSFVNDVLLNNGKDGNSCFSLVTHEIVQLRDGLLLPWNQFDL